MNKDYIEMKAKLNFFESRQIEKTVKNCLKENKVFNNSKKLIEKNFNKELSNGELEAK